MRIRDAEVADTAQIAEIWNHNIRDTVTTFTTVEKTAVGLATEIAERQAKGFPFLVAEEGGVIMGFATYGPFRGGPGYAYTAEHSIMLRTDAMGRGLGRQLMTALESRACAAGLRVLIGGLSGENTAAKAFHSALGFEVVGILPETGRKFDRWLDLILMQKRL